MHGWKFLLSAALAANKYSLDQGRPSTQEIQKNLNQPLTSSGDVVFGRRQVLQSILSVGVVVAGSAQPSFGLDMDAFVNSQLAADKANCNPKQDPKCAPKLSADEAMCQYGQSGEARGEACKRVRAAGGSLPGATKTKSLGGAYAM